MAHCLHVPVTKAIIVIIIIIITIIIMQNHAWAKATLLETRMSSLRMVEQAVYQFFSLCIPRGQETDNIC